MHPFVQLDPGKEVFFGYFFARHGKQKSGNKQPDNSGNKSWFDLEQGVIISTI